MTLRGVDNVKFRKQVVPGDRLELDEGGAARPPSTAEAIAMSNGRWSPEAELVLVIEPCEPAAESAWAGEGIHPAASSPGRDHRRGHGRGAYATIGPRVTIGNHCRIGASAS